MVAGADTKSVAERVAEVRERMAVACARANRATDSVRLVAISKKQPEERVRAAMDAGLREFGENYAQELAARVSSFSEVEGVRWRFVGPLQSNKVNLVVRTGAAIDSLHSPDLADALRRRVRHQPIEVLIQVNTAGESQKSGCAPSAVPALVEAVRAMPELNLRGLMTVPPFTDDPEDARPHFRTLAALARSLALSELSMGMSADFEVAIEEGATMIRVGTDLFGPR